MAFIKKMFGLVWMMIGPVAFAGLMFSALYNINSSVKGDISNPVPWIIILCIFAPISVGLTVFGWYCWRNEYANKIDDPNL